VLRRATGRLVLGALVATAVTGAARATSAAPVRLAVTGGVVTVAADTAANIQAYTQDGPSCRDRSVPLAQCPPAQVFFAYNVTLIDLRFTTPDGLAPEAPAVALGSDECYLLGQGRNWARCTRDAPFVGAAVTLSDEDDSILWQSTFPASIDARGGDDTLASGWHAFLGTAHPDGPTKYVGGDGRDTVDYSTRCDHGPFQFFGEIPEYVAEGVRLSNDGQANDGVRGEADDIGTDVEVLIGGDGDDTLVGSGGDDTLLGDIPDEHARCDMFGGADYPDGGRDVVKGRGGNDTVMGGAFADKLVGNGGDDDLHGGGGVDTLRPGPGDDLVDALDGAAEVVACGAGTDRYRADAVDRVRSCELVL